MSKRIGLFGGTFDPIHDGHLDIAKKARKQYHLDEVWFVVAAISPFKVDAQPTSFKHRYAMVKHMVSPYRYFKVSEVENQLPKPSYSIDTIRYFKRRFPQTEFYWIMGSDQASKFEQWKEPQAIRKSVSLLVYPRRNDLVPDGFNSLTGSFLDISSTDIRLGKSRATSKSVLRYMVEHNLYTKEWLKEKVSLYRLSHIKTMTECAVDIAKFHHLNEDEVRCAGYMHDYAKDMTSESDKKWLSTIDPRYASQPKALWHAAIASFVLSKKYYVKNRKIKRAIEGHVVGSSTSKMGMVLYIADKCDPGRGLGYDPIIKKAKTDLIGAFKQSKKNAEIYRKGKNNEE